jgi:two-component system CheB/CheR fusion protein
MSEQPPDSPDVEALLGYLKRSRGFDFTAYKRPSLTRRIEKRMQAVGVKGFADYTDYLEVHPDEFTHLFNNILINVTSFFRDDTAWQLIRESVLPALAGSPQDQHQIRVWTAGCASGEETYSAAMLLAEAIGRDAFRDRVKIYATDVDDDALLQARAATYDGRQVQMVPPDLLERYFTRNGDLWTFDKDLRRQVIFGRHDLIQDAPISRVNLLICRNTLMYFNSEAQSRILARFHFALADEGVLFLGKAEMPFMQSTLFNALDLRRRVFRKLPRYGWHDRLALLTLAADETAGGDDGLNAAVLAAGFEVAPHAQVLLDAAGALATFNERAAALFNLAPADVGRPLQDLQMSYRPVELRSLIDQALTQRRAVGIKDIPWQNQDPDTRGFDVSVAPLIDAAGRLLGVSVAFVDVSRVRDLQLQLTRLKQDLETAYEELQSTNEELETTNEELQSTVEELETTNEELQSTNEELETMNEELQSTNEELHTTNDELRQRGDDLNRSHSFLESILTGLRSAVVVLDRELHVVAWNPRAEDLWGLRGAEVRGQNFLNLDIGLPADQLRTGIRACLNGEQAHAELSVPAVNRRGRKIVCRVTGTPLTGEGKDVRGVILLMEEQPADVVH